MIGLGTVIAVATISPFPPEALAQRFSTGREGGDTLIMRGIEFGAAELVLLFGYLAAERVT